MEIKQQMLGVKGAVSVLHANSEKQAIKSLASIEAPYRAAFSKSAVAFAIDTGAVLNNPEEVAEYLLNRYEYLQGSAISRWENPYKNKSVINIGPFHSHCPMNLEVDEFKITIVLESSDILVDHLDIHYLLKSLCTIALYQETLHEVISLLLKALYTEEIYEEPILTVITTVKAGRSENTYTSSF